MSTRILTALLTIPIFLAMIYFGGVFLQCGLAILVMLGIYEFSRWYENEAFWDYLIIAGLSFLYLAYTGFNDSFLLIWFALQLMYLLIRATISTLRPLSQMWQMGAVFYISGLFSFLWLLRDEYGFLLTLFGIVITWVTDSAAYFIGIKFGKTPLAPAISPKKTREGSLGGILFAAIFAAVFALINEYSILPIVALGIFLSIIGQTGDLVESAMKRERVVKDSGKILPGHGGILDRFDSLLFVIPTLYLILKLFPALI